MLQHSLSFTWLQNFVFPKDAKKKLSEQPVPSTARKEKKKKLNLGSALKAI